MMAEYDHKNPAALSKLLQNGVSCRPIPRKSWRPPTRRRSRFIPTKRQEPGVQEDSRRVRQVPQDPERLVQRCRTAHGFFLQSHSKLAWRHPQACPPAGFFTGGLRLPSAGRCRRCRRRRRFFPAQGEEFASPGLEFLTVPDEGKLPSRSISGQATGTREPRRKAPRSARREMQPIPSPASTARLMAPVCSSSSRTLRRGKSAPNAVSQARGVPTRVPAESRSRRGVLPGSPAAARPGMVGAQKTVSRSASQGSTARSGSRQGLR